MNPENHRETAKLFLEVVWALLGLGLACWTVSIAVYTVMGDDIALLWTFVLTPGPIPLICWCLYRSWWHQREAAL